MTSSLRFPLSLLVALGLVGIAGGVATMVLPVPTDVEMPGTQPGEIPALLPPEQCDACHGGYDPEVEPSRQWRGSPMAHATRDPLFWAAMAVAEQDFPGAGDLCLRCHAPAGWLDGRSTPTNGAGLTDEDGRGVSCHVCHRLTDPDGTGAWQGVQNPPYIANDGGQPAEGFYGSGMAVLLEDDIRLGPYRDATAAPHAFGQSQFMRRSELCGTCHDVSNPVVGDLAPGHGAQKISLRPGTFSGVPGAPVDQKAAFNNPPYRYGAVERTFSEAKASTLDGLPVSEYPNLPPELQDGALEEAYLAATAVRADGNYEDGSERTFNCQTCHMPPAEGRGCVFGPTRSDVPRHDLVGANHWIGQAIRYLDARGRLRLAGNLTPEELIGLADGRQRARHNLTMAASLRVENDDLIVTNLTGHKLFTGYPEGRRMWLRVNWYDAFGEALREDGAYGGFDVLIGGQPKTVETLLELDGPHTHVFEATLGMTQEWAARLIGWGWDPTLALTYDRVSGAVANTLGDLAGQAPGTAWTTFHFALNDVITFDNRIPPYGMNARDAALRNTLPVPESLYGDPGPNGVYDHWARVALDPPAGAATAEIELLYQTTSWEYVQFLQLANDGQDPFLSTVGDDLLDAWRHTGMAEPVVMASTAWRAPLVDCNGNGVDDEDDIANGTSQDANGNGIPDECECRTEVYCQGAPNSVGAGARISWNGSVSIAANQFHLTVSGAVPDQLGLFFYGGAQVQVPFGDGFRCVGSDGLTRIWRLNPAQRAGIGGTDSRHLDFTRPPAGSGPGQIHPFSTWYFQYTYRDPAAGGSGFNQSDGLRVTFCP